MSKKDVTPQTHKPDIPLNEYYTTPSDDFNIKVSERLTGLEHDQNHQQELINEIKQRQTAQEERLKAIEDHVKTCKILTKLSMVFGTVVAALTGYCISALELLDKVKTLFSSSD